MAYFVGRPQGNKSTRVIFLCLALISIIYLLRMRDTDATNVQKSVDCINIPHEKEQKQPSTPTFQDEYFAPTLSLWKKKVRGELEPALKSFRSGSIPKFFMYSYPSGARRAFLQASLHQITADECPLPCNVTYDPKEVKSSDAVMVLLMNAVDKDKLTTILSPRDPRQPWIMFAYDPPTILGGNKSPLSNYNNLFNRTLTYRLDSDIILNFGFIVSREDAQVLPGSWSIRGPSPPSLSELEKQMKNKSLAVIFLSHCNAHSNREQYLRKFQKFAQLDIYGKCGDKICDRSMYTPNFYNITTYPCFKMAYESYLFNFAFENNLCVDFRSERVYNLLYYPIIPVVRGSANYSKVLPPMSYIDAMKYSPKELAEKLLYLQRNPKEYMKYLEWRHYYQPSTIGGRRMICHLCSRLYDPEFYEHQVIEDLDDWWVSKSRCLSELTIYND